MSRQDVWIVLKVLALAGIMIAPVVHGQANVTMTITGTVRWGNPGRQTTPQGYNKGAPIHGIDVIAYLTRGTDVHGLPVVEVLARTKSDESGRYTLTFSVSVAENYVRVKAVSSWGEGVHIVPVTFGKLVVDLQVDSGHQDYGDRAVSGDNTATAEIWSSEVLVAYAAIILACCATLSAGVVFRRLRQSARMRCTATSP